MDGTFDLDYLQSSSLSVVSRQIGENCARVIICRALPLPTAARGATPACPGVPSSPPPWLIHNPTIAVTLWLMRAGIGSLPMQGWHKGRSLFNKQRRGVKTAALSIEPPVPPNPKGQLFTGGWGGKCSGLDLLSNQTLKRKRNSRYFPEVIKKEFVGKARQSKLEEQGFFNQGPSAKRFHQ